MKPTIIFLTGITGVGKTTAGTKIAEICDEKSLSVRFYNDYPFVVRWARTIAREDQVTWFQQEDGSENFAIQPFAYPELSAWVAEEMAAEIKTEIESLEIVVVESARGAGEGALRDHYGEHLYKPFQKHLEGRAQFVNLQTTVQDIEVLLERINERLLHDPESAPAFVAHKYLDNGRPQDAVAEAESAGVQFELNTSIFNDGELEDFLRQIEGFLAPLIMRELAQDSRSESVEGNQPSRLER